MTTLQVSFGEHVGVYHPGDLVRIGRALDNQIQVDTFGVSSHHAIIEFNGAAWQVRNLGSTNGTFWNGQPVATLPVISRRRVSLRDVDRWGFAAAAATVNYQGLGGCEPADFSAGPSAQPVCLGSWAHEPSRRVQNMMLFGILAASFLAIAWVLLMRSDPAAAMNQDADEELSKFEKWIGLQ